MEKTVSVQNRINSHSIDKTKKYEEDKYEQGKSESINPKFSNIIESNDSLTTSR